NWQSYTGFENPAEMLDVFGFDTEGISLRNCVVESAEGAIHAIYTCENMSLVQFDDIPYRGIYRSPADEYFLAYNNDVKPQSYRMSWSEFEIDSDFSARYDSETAQRYSGTVWGDAYLKAKEDADLNKAVLMSEETRRACWKSDESYERAKELTAEITAGCTTDYQKAKAICNYFHSNDFVYDKEFAATDSSIDNFIFNTKRGVCFNYATAMALLCREAGLNSRYCEGFLVQKYDNEKGCWAVTAENSHAFVQVWIDGYGWTDFDPTSNNIDGGYTDLTFMYVGITVGIIGAVVILCLFLRPYMAESRLLGRIKRSRGRKQAVLVYNSIGDMLVKYSGGKENPFTPTELSDECERLFGYDISGFISQYSRLVYSNTEDSDNDFSAVYSEFRKAYRLRIKEDKKNRRKNKKK
ncbi:MAG: transglutaminase family protein, partial [Ruminiclostridium sp.]